MGGPGEAVVRVVPAEDRPRSSTRRTVDPSATPRLKQTHFSRRPGSGSAQAPLVAAVCRTTLTCRIRRPVVDSTVILRLATNTWSPTTGMRPNSR